MSTPRKSTLGAPRNQGPSPFKGIVAGTAKAAEVAPVVEKPKPQRITPERVAAVNALAPSTDTKTARKARARRKQMMPLDMTRPVLNRAEAAQYLGIGLSTLLKVAQAGRDSEGKALGHTRVGARLAFLREDLDRYIRNEDPRQGAAVGWKVNPNRVAARKAAAQ